MNNAHNIAALEEAMVQINKGALVAISHSGGKDSQAMYAVLMMLVPIEQICVIHADLGEVEWAGAKEHIVANIDASHELHVTEAIYKNGAKKDLLDMVLRRWVHLLDKHARLNAAAANGEQLTKAEANFANKPVPAPWFGSATRYCTSDMKRDPIAKVFRRIAAERGCDIVINATGIRADESTERSKKSPWEVNKKNTNKSRTVYDWMPIFNWTTEDVFAAIEAAGQQPHEMYAKGMSRFSCCFCFYQKKADMQIAAREADPKLYAKYVAIERVTGYTYMPGGKDMEAFTGIAADAALVAEAIAEIHAQGYVAQAEAITGKAAKAA